MSVASLAQLPLAAGGVLAGALARAGWIGIQRYMRAPVSNTGILMLVSLTALAASNALFQQTMPHPAPFLAPPAGVPQPVEQPAELAGAPVPAPLPEPPMPNRAESAVTGETTGTISPAQVIPDQPVGNAEVFEVQRRLLELGFFQGTIDGYYGPRTAAAIRAFEERHGMTPMGAMTPEVVRAITGQGPGAALAPAPAVGVPPGEPAVAASPAVVPASAPIPAQNPSATQTAATTIDSIVAAIEGIRSTPQPVAQPPVPSAPVPSVASSVSIPAQAMPPVPVADIAVAATEPVTSSSAPPNAGDASLVTQVQRGLASLAFLRGPIDGRPSDGLARAIRNFEVYHNYPVTGDIRPELVDMLVAAGATL